MQSFHIGGIDIKVLQKKESIEMFEMFSDREEVGPGIHFHRNMEESFYVISGRVVFTVEGRQIIGTAGSSITMPRNTNHNWKVGAKNTRMLIIFTPAGNQTEYFSQLEKLYNQGDSWKAAITKLATEFDNTLV